MGNTNASAAAFGWEFQFNAGIMLMLDNIKQAIEVKIEGETEDIEITLNDKMKIFAQAKSVESIEDYSHVKDKLTAALKTLNAAEKTGEAKALIYITNTPNPCNESKSIICFSSGVSHIKYDDLPEVCKAQINAIYEDKNLKFPLEKFSIFVFDFSGDGENRYRIVKYKISEFLYSLDSEFSGMVQRALDRWRLDFGENATQNNRNTKISKKQMMWPLILWYCENKETARLDELDSVDKEEILKRYSYIINTNSERFELFTKIINLYEDYRNEEKHLKKIDIDEFIRIKCNFLNDEFDFSSVSDYIRLEVLKLTVEKVISTRHTVNNIREKVQL